MRETVAAFLVPILTTILLLYSVLAHLQIALLNEATLIIAGAALLGAAAVGVVAALGPPLVRIVLLAGCAVLLLDTMLPLRQTFERLAGS